MIRTAILALFSLLLAGSAYAQGCGNIGQRRGGSHTYTQVQCNNIGPNGNGTVVSICTDSYPCNVQGSYGGGSQQLTNQTTNNLAQSVGLPTLPSLNNLSNYNLGPYPPTVGEANRFWDLWPEGGAGCGDEHDHDSC